jgi:ATP-dependent RNA helicase DDX5/DBP2
MSAATDAGPVDVTITNALSLWKAYLIKTLRKTGNDNVSLTPTPIQRQLWSLLLQTSYNVVSIAPTGSGKTLSYVLPTLLSNKNTLVLVPTRELVQQVASVYQRVIQLQQQKTLLKSDNAHVRPIVSIYGGLSRQDQLRQLEKANAASNISSVVVATPGRLLDILKQEESHGISPHWVVLDEADQLTKDGDLGPQVQDILSLLSARAQRKTRMVFVSATLTEKSHKKFEEWIDSDYVLVQVNSSQRSAAVSKAEMNDDMENEVKVAAGMDHVKEQSSDSVSLLKARAVAALSQIPSHLDQIVHVCSEHKKPRKLVHTLQSIQKRKKPPNSSVNGVHQRGIVFYSKIEKLEYSCKLLRREGLQCFPLHGQLSTAERQKNLHSFASSGRKEGTPLSLLLATDVAARGIDIPGIDFVIQYDFPGNLEQYIHRCGRAGRSNNTCHAGTSSETNEMKMVNETKDFVVHSFFTRNLHAMASDLVELLEANKAWVDPNLRALIQESSAAAKSGKHAKSRIGKSFPSNQKSKKATANPTMGTQKIGSVSDSAFEATSDEDEFAQLSATRIVLKRADHVSDASDDEESLEIKSDA